MLVGSPGFEEFSSLFVQPVGEYHLRSSCLSHLGALDMGPCFINLGTLLDPGLALTMMLGYVRLVGN